MIKIINRDIKDDSFKNHLPYHVCSSNRELRQDMIVILYPICYF